MKSEILELNYVGGKSTEQVHIRLDTFKVEGNALAYIEAGKNEEWRVYVPLHRLNGWRYRKWNT